MSNPQKMTSSEETLNKSSKLLEESVSLQDVLKI